MLKLETINQRIRFYRSICGYNQSEMAEKLGMKCSTYSQRERNGTISVEFAQQIAEVLHINIDVLIHGEKYVERKKRELLLQSHKTEPEKTADTFNPPEIEMNDLNNREQNIIKTLRLLKTEEIIRIHGIINDSYKNKKNRSRKNYR